VTASFSYTKAEHFKSRKRIEHLFAKGKAIQSGSLRMFYFLERSPSAQSTLQSRKGLLQCGVGASKKNFSRAVDRNRIKRLLREGYRKQKSLLMDSLFPRAVHAEVFFIYSGKEMPGYSELEEQVNALLLRLQKIVHEKFAENT
jgi:ribonuclease P protein component